MSIRELFKIGDLIGYANPGGSAYGEMWYAFITSVHVPIKKFYTLRYSASNQSWRSNIYTYTYDDAYLERVGAYKLALDVYE